MRGRCFQTACRSNTTTFRRDAPPQRLQTLKELLSKDYVTTATDWRVIDDLVPRNLGNSLDIPAKEEHPGGTAVHLGRRQEFSRAPPILRLNQWAGRRSGAASGGPVLLLVAPV